ncbi:MBL fold metallo-hydrolase [candidate division KSB1 bacterium]
MIEEIFPRLYKINIPLPKNPLIFVNSYVISDGNRNLIIDTGLNQDDSFITMQFCLKKIGVDLSKTDFFITHFHADHIGLLGKLADRNSRIYFNEPDSALISAGGLWDETIEFHNRLGYPMQKLIDFLVEQPAYRYFEKGNLQFNTVFNGDEINFGDYRFICVATPGHTRGHMCLYEPDKKFLISGDHIIDDISPNISQWFENENPVAEYLDSLDKVSKLDIEVVLPGHRSLIHDCNNRIDELRKHHQTRIDDIINILKTGPGDVYAVASKMKWDINDFGWDDFPVFQQWFAFCEALAHLTYLVSKDLINKTVSENGIVYSII